MPDLTSNNVNDQDINLRKKWRAVQAISNMFWKRWIGEYLPQLTVRKKWSLKDRNLKKGDLVIVRSSNLPRHHWPLGRISDVYPGKDEIVRSVKVKTPTGEFIRSSRLLHLLEAAE